MRYLIHTLQSFPKYCKVSFTFLTPKTSARLLLCWCDGLVEYQKSFLIFLRVSRRSQICGIRVSYLEMPACNTFIWLSGCLLPGDTAPGLGCPKYLHTPWPHHLSWPTFSCHSGLIRPWLGVDIPHILLPNAVALLAECPRCSCRHDWVILNCSPRRWRCSQDLLASVVPVAHVSLSLEQIGQYYFGHWYITDCKVKVLEFQPLPLQSRCR